MGANMTDPGVHPDSGAAFVPVERATDPVVRVHDLAMIEFAGPDTDRDRNYFSDFGLTAYRDRDGHLQFSSEAGAPVCLVYRPAR